MTRNSGTRFHEGLDIAAVSVGSDGSPEDGIFSVCPGKVVHVCREVNGSYGKYVVLEHRSGNIVFYTLYAHLNTVFSDVREGLEVPEGRLLGKMGGTSSVYDFPAGTEHLHFEVGLRLGGESFFRWYESAFPPDDENLHGVWNGLNLEGSDPLAFLRFAQEHEDFRDYLDSIPVAVSAVVGTEKIPEILEVSPGLLRGALPSKISGFEVRFSWSGMPLAFVPLAGESGPDGNAESGICFVSKKYMQNLVKRGMVSEESGNVRAGPHLRRVLSVIFGEPFPE